MWTGRTGEAFSQARSDASAGLQPGSPLHGIKLVLGLLARLVFDRSSCSFTPTCRLVSLFLTVAVPGRNEATFAPVSPTLGQCSSSPQPDVTICDLSPLFLPAFANRIKLVLSSLTGQTGLRTAPRVLCTEGRCLSWPER